MMTVKSYLPFALSAYFFLLYIVSIVNGIPSDRKTNPKSSGSPDQKRSPQKNSPPSNLVKTSYFIDYEDDGKSFACQKGISAVLINSERKRKNDYSTFKENLHLPKEEINTHQLVIGREQEVDDPYGWIAKAWESMKNKPSTPLIIKTLMSEATIRHERFKKQLLAMSDFFGFLNEQSISKQLTEIWNLKQEYLSLYFKEKRLFVEFLPILEEATFQSVSTDRTLDQKIQSTVSTLDMYTKWQINLISEVFYSVLNSYCSKPRENTPHFNLPSAFLPIELEKRVFEIPIPLSHNQLSCKNYNGLKNNRIGSNRLLHEEMTTLRNLLPSPKKPHEGLKSPDFFFDNVFYYLMLSSAIESPESVKNLFIKRRNDFGPRKENIIKYVEEWIDMSYDYGVDRKMQWGSQNDGILLEFNPLTEKLTVTLFPSFSLHELHKKIAKIVKKSDALSEERKQNGLVKFNHISNILRHQLRFQELYVELLIFAHWQRLCEQRLY